MSASIKTASHPPYHTVSRESWKRAQLSAVYGGAYVAHQSAKWQRAAKYAARDQLKTRGR